MMLKTKYLFLKRLYPDKVIVLEKYGNYYLFGEDDYVFDFFLRKRLIFYLREYHVDYMVVENYEVKEDVVYIDNYYHELMIKGLLIKALKRENQ